MKIPEEYLGKETRKPMSMNACPVLIGRFVNACKYFVGKMHL